jgi:CRISPR-associated endonuclease/helicase Cas3
MKPIHAGLLGSDVLFLLDEVHLSQPFRQTLGAVRCYRTWAERPLSTPFEVVEMSATPGDSDPDAFRLNDDDRRNETLAARLTAAKPTQLVSVGPKAFVDEVQRRVQAMLKRPGAAIAVVVNRVNTAREIHQRLRVSLTDKPVDVALLTGRMRPLDRDVVEAQLGPRISSGRIRQPSDRPIVVVATQSIEAGADFDFDDLVSECASLDALRQRFGRLDRLGDLAGSSRGVIIARTDRLKDDAVYGSAIGNTWTWLQGQRSGDRVDFGISALTVPEDARSRGLLAPLEHAPTLLPSHLDAWVQTEPTPLADPEVALWLHGPQRGLADVQVVWRADLSSALLTQAASGDKDTRQRASAAAVAIVDALPPVAAEAMTVPFLAASRWLQGLTEPETSDVEGSLDEDDTASERIGTPRPVVIWQGEQSCVAKPLEIKPGQTLVVPASYGGIDQGNWCPSATDSVKDLAEVAAWHRGRRPTLRLHPAVIGHMFDAGVPAPVVASSEEESIADREFVRDWLQLNGGHASHEAVRDIIDALRANPKSLRVERLDTGLAPPDPSEYLVVTGKRRPYRLADEAPSDAVSTEDSRSSFTGARVTLQQHLQGVAETTTGVAQRVGVSPGLAGDLRVAAEWHDAGKADIRFQRWLHGGSEFKALVQAEPLAKSAVRLTNRGALRQARERAGYPEGSRHELLSLSLVQSAAGTVASAAADWELVQHLVAAHHGYCRPFAPFVSDDAATEVTFHRNGIQCTANSAHALERLDSGIAERFWTVTRRYGWWGTALLEAILRLADHRQSEREEDSRVVRNENHV